MFIFHIDEIYQHENALEVLDREGKWIPHTEPGYNVRKPPGYNGSGVTGQLWYFNGHSIQPLKTGTPPGAVHYSTFSAYFCGGHGFHILKGDATNPPEGATWHPLKFEHDPTNYSSSLTNAGPERAMRVHNPLLTWHQVLLPNIYHGSAYPYDKYGGLTGELPIFLALIALSMGADRLESQLPKLVVNGEWTTHNRSHGCKHNDPIDVPDGIDRNIRGTQTRRHRFRILLPWKRQTTT